MTFLNLKMMNFLNLIVLLKDKYSNTTEKRINSV